jgi:solute carrier family 35 protein E1
MSASNALGLACAFGSAIVFVSSNIFFKKIMPSTPAGTATPSHKLDKINLLFYSSGMAFLLMIPIWLYYDLGALMHHQHGSSSHNQPHYISPHGVAYYFFLNGTVHFAQNIIAFVILSSTSPVTYSIASLVKRIAVICIAIVWFSQRIHPIQGFGICLTFVGLYMYNAAKGDVERGENKMRRVEAQKDLMLPSTSAEVRMMNGSPAPESQKEHSPVPFSTSSAYTATQQQPLMFAHSHRLPHRHQAPRHLPALNTTLKPQLTSVISPTESYPSPPPSSESPPTSPVHLVAPSKLHRRGTISHNTSPLPPTITVTASAD